MNLDYRAPHSKQTLRTALAELRAAEGSENDAASQVAPELERDLDIHDAIHVIFGCSTDVPGEVLAHVWTVLGTSGPVASGPPEGAIQDWPRPTSADVDHQHSSDCRYRLEGIENDPAPAS